MRSLQLSSTRWKGQGHRHSLSQVLSCPVNAYVVLLLVDVRRVAAVYALGGRATTDTCGCPTGALLRAASGSDKSAAAAAAARRTAAFAAHPYLGLGLPRHGGAAHPHRPPTLQHPSCAASAPRCRQPPTIATNHKIRHDHRVQGVGRPCQKTDLELEYTVGVVYCC